MFGADAVQKLKQNRSLSRRVNERNFQKPGRNHITPHDKRSLADPEFLKGIAKDTRQRNRKDDISAMLIVVSFLGLMIAMFFWMLKA